MSPALAFPSCGMVCWQSGCLTSPKPQTRVSQAMPQTRVRSSWRPSGAWLDSCFLSTSRDASRRVMLLDARGKRARLGSASVSPGPPGLSIFRLLPVFLSCFSSSSSVSRRPRDARAPSEPSQVPVYLAFLPTSNEGRFFLSESLPAKASSEDSRNCLRSGPSPIGAPTSGRPRCLDPLSRSSPRDAGSGESGFPSKPWSTVSPGLS